MKQSNRVGFSIFLLVFIIQLAPALHAQATIDTVAGGGPDGIPALHANLWWPTAVTVDAGGTLYLTAWHRVYRLDASGGIHAYAGVGGDRTYGGDGLPALSGNLYYPGAIAFDDNHNLFIADTYNSRIRRVDAVTGIITTFAGGGLANPGNGGQATDARLGFTTGLVTDAAGNLYFSDYDNHRVRKVDAATGIISTVAGTGICGFTGNGGQAALARICGPTHLALNRATGTLYMAELSNSTVRRITLGTGIINTLTGLPRNSGLALDAAAGFLYISSLGNSRIYRFNLATGTSTPISGVFNMDLDPTGGGLALDGAGGLYFAAAWAHRVYRLNLATGVATIIAGNGESLDSEDGFLARQTWLFFPGSVARDGSQNLYVAENRIRRIDAATGVVSTLQAIPVGGGAPEPAPAGLLFGNPDDSLYIGVGDPYLLRRDGATGALSIVAGTGEFDFSGDGGPATAAAITYVNGIARDGSGNLYFSDGENYRVRRIDHLTGIITTVAGNGDFHYGGDGGPATSAGMDAGGLGFDGAGNLYISDGFNHRIRKVDAATGVITTVVGSGVRGTSGDGGPATAAQVRSTSPMLVDGAGNITFGDDSRIRRVDAASGTIDTIAGSLISGWYGDGGPALDARFDLVADLLDDGAGNLYVTDLFSFNIRKLTFSTNAAPEAQAGADIQAECASVNGAVVTLDGSSSTDPDSVAPTNDIETYEWFENYGGEDQSLLGTGVTCPATLSLGTHLITLRATDHAGLSDTDEVEVSVQDNTPPEIEVVMSPEILSPPNHQFLPVHASVSASDACGAVSVALVQVASSESDLPDGSADDSDVRDAGFGTADYDFELRAKRTGGSSGRIYTVVYRTVDGSGNETLSSDTVHVKHDRRSRRSPSDQGGGKPKPSRQASR